MAGFASGDERAVAGGEDVSGTEGRGDDGSCTV